MPKTKIRNAYMQLILSIFAWGGVYQSANYLVKTLDPFSTAFVRYLIAAIILLLLRRRQHGEFINVVQFKQNWLLLISLGVLGIGLYNLVFFGAEKYLSATLVVTIFAFSPCLTAYLGALVFKQRITGLAYLGMALALVGTIGVINFASCGHYSCHATFEQLSRGQVFALLMCLLAALYSLMNRQATLRNIDSLTITTYAAVFGMLVLFIAAVIFGHLNQVWQQSGTFWLVMLYTALIGSVGAYFWFSEALAQLGVATTAVFLNAIPLSTILIGVIFLGQSIALPVIGYGLIIVSGVMLSNFAFRS